MARVVIVTYNSADVIGHCLTALREDVASGLVEVVVVDNGSEDSTLQAIQSFDWARLIQSDSNIGFGAGNNLGSIGAETDYLVFLNPDTMVKRDSIEKLIKYLTMTPGVGIVGPAIEDEAGVVTLSTFSFLTPFSSIWIALGLQRLIPLNRTNGHAELRRNAPEDTCHVDRILGAAMATPRRTFEAVGGFDEDFFLYSEEEDLCKRMKDRGETVVYLPEARVTHLGGHSAIPNSPIAIASSVWSRQHFIHKHYGRLWEVISCLFWIVALTVKFLATLLIPRLRNRSTGYLLALRSLISSVFYSENVRPERVTPVDPT